VLPSLSLNIFKDIRTINYEKALSEGKIQIIGESIDKDYLSAVLNCLVRKELPSAQPNLKILYTPLHGAGLRLVPEALRQAGYTDVDTVASQMTVDGDFPTVEKPNPQYESSFAPALEMAKSKAYDLIIATDPDADRMGVMVLHEGKYVHLSGNQAGLVMLEYLIRAKRETGLLPANAAAVKSLVSTRLADIVCERNGVAMFNVYTGFKYIGEKIAQFESSKSNTFLFGFEESYGYLPGTYARDKDGVAAALILCEAAACAPAKTPPRCSRPT
jgi:phosphoglucomutase